MRRLIILWYAALQVTVISGCSSLVQTNIPVDSPVTISTENGMITGSTTAPFAQHYHESVFYHYRSLNDGGKHKGVLTSGLRYPHSHGDKCDADGLDKGKCGRLFAVLLPAGQYEIYKLVVSGQHLQLSPAMFTVSKGGITYLGNLNMQYCVGMGTRYRGYILGGDVSINDEYERDSILLKRKFSALSKAKINKHLLPERSWHWRTV